MLDSDNSGLLFSRGKHARAGVYRRPDGLSWRPKKHALLDTFVLPHMHILKSLLMRLVLGVRVGPQSNCEEMVGMMDLEKQVFAYLEEHGDDMVKYLQQLLRVDTQVPPGLNYDKICSIMADKFSESGCDVKVHDATEEYLKLSGRDLIKLEGPRSNVVARYPGRTGHPVLHVSAHIDTAAIQKEGWTVDPLEGRLTRNNPHGTSLYDKGRGYIWGRGANDDKGECVVMTYVVKALHELGIKLNGDLILTGNCDEEIGGVAGLGYLIRERIVKADYGIQLDGGMTSIGLAAQGRARFMIRTMGKPWHGQTPILGINAIEKMSKINVALNDYWRNVLLRIQKAVPGIELPSDLRQVGIDKLTAMLNIGTIKGGLQGATVPDECEEEILRGMIPGESFGEVDWRCSDLEESEAIWRVLQNCAESAALCTQTKPSWQWVAKCRPGLPNLAIARLVQRNIELVGPVRFSEDEKEFARKIMQNMGYEPHVEPYEEKVEDAEEREAMLRQILAPEQMNWGSDDYVEFTWHAPCARFHIGCTTALKAPRTAPKALGQARRAYPTWVYGALCGTSMTHKTAWVAAKVMGLSLLDLVLNPDQLKKAQDEFKERTGGGVGGSKWIPPLLPKELNPPIELNWPEWIDNRYPEGNTKNVKWHIAY